MIDHCPAKSKKLWTCGVGRQEGSGNGVLGRQSGFGNQDGPVIQGGDIKNQVD